MVKLTKSTADRAGEIICAYFVLQQRRALVEDQEAPYFDLDDLRKYADKCGEEYRYCLTQCKDIADLEILHRAVQKQLHVDNDAYAHATKTKKRKSK